ncbi:beta-ketoacyl-ACP synthase III [Gudongella oleilytica]|uniref:beta-ketoacyl-ACP synthase III n=1 Tax=Gudongella oleilytica TaxID=1582259 RepID=UPI0023EA6757|nr:beta-ketoacyl-ACP synthase III [Gudongella oleilytica]
MKKISVGITGLGSYVPERVVTNDDISKLVETSDEWIVTRTGIKERRVADENVATSDLAIKAAELALEDSGLDADELDLIIVATATPDHAFPSTAALVQKNLGASKAAAFDLSVGCSGFIYGMVTGANFITSGMYKKVLVIGAETLSKIVDWTDRNTCVLFGDGAGACVLESCDESFGILASELGSDGLNGDVLILPAGGSRYPATAETVKNKLHTIKMDGKEVFKFAVRVMEKSSMRVLEEAGLTQDQLDFFIPHQANMRIVDAAMKKLQLGREKTHINMDKYGNMSAASVPVALDEAFREGKIKQGDVVLLIAFGAGLSWASIVMRWNRRDRDV